MRITFFVLLTLLSSCKFLNHQKLIKEVNSNNGSSITIYVVKGSATTNDAIILKRKENNEERRIDFFERYDLVDSSKLINDSTLFLVLRNSGSSAKTPSDTFYVNIYENN